MSGQHKIAWLCEALLVSRSGYYDWKKRRHQPGPRQVDNERLRKQIREEFARSRHRPMAVLDWPVHWDALVDVTALRV
jgi:hypothetical protein